MPTEKEIKNEFRIKAQKDPEKYYPVEVLKQEGFSRKKCAKCRNYFWSADPNRKVCGEPDCSGGYTFIGNSPAREKMDFIKTWQKFVALFKKFGYTPIPRYPVTARWRDDTDFVQASIYDFQPYCVSGEIDPPANPLVVPQFCLRFNDTDNVGVTGRHYTGFVMIGQHSFQKPENYKPKDYLHHIYAWLVEGMKLPKEEIQFHEDAWAGGGNMGPSIEYFSRGLEIGNQVYMQYDIKSGAAKELAIKVLDMGMGQERPAWFTHGTNTSYEAVFPTVVKELFKKTGVKPDQESMHKFLPYSGILTIDERDVEKAWKEIAEKIGEDVKKLKEQVLSLAAIYSIGDHTRSLLVALNDGALPSNVGGGYNLRVLLRRSLDLIEKYGWDISLLEVCKTHAKYLKPQYPELSEHLDEIEEILEIEREKYGETKEKSGRIIEKLASSGASFDFDTQYKLYDSHGISPEMLTAAAASFNFKIEPIPDFYMRVAEKHESETRLSQQQKFKEFDLGGIEKTEILYYDDYALVEFRAKVMKILEGTYVVLDKTAFYPTSGGQFTDKGYMNESVVSDVFKQGNVVIHRVANPSFKEGDVVSCKIDWNRRKQLAQHHTATHIINGVSRQLLGEHIWQAGAEKTPEKSRLDITHFAALSKKELKEIEKKANEAVAKNMSVDKKFYRRDIAEKNFGFRLYQGGAVPGKEIRVIRIDELDTEACGGTHLNSTKEVEHIRLIGATKIQDGVVRLEYVAGEAAKNYMTEKVLKPYVAIVQNLSSGSTISPLIEKLGNKKTQKKVSEIEKSLALLKEKSLDKLNKKEIVFIDSIAEEIEEAAEVFSVTIDQLGATMDRFLKEIIEDANEIGRLNKELNLPAKKSKVFGEMQIEEPLLLPQMCNMVFRTWKEQRKELDKLREEVAKERIKSLTFEKIGKYEFLVESISASMEEAMKTAKELVGANKAVVLFGISDKISIVGMSGSNLSIDMGEIVKKAGVILGGGGGGSPTFARGAGQNREKLEEAKEWVVRYLKEKLA